MNASEAVEAVELARDALAEEFAAKVIARFMDPHYGYSDEWDAIVLEQARKAAAALLESGWLRPSGQLEPRITDQVTALLAKAYPIKDFGDAWYHECYLCRAATPVAPEDHKPDCPWLLAKDWEKFQRGDLGSSAD